MNGVSDWLAPTIGAVSCTLSYIVYRHLNSSYYIFFYFRLHFENFFRTVNVNIEYVNVFFFGEAATSKQILQMIELVSSTCEYLSCPGNLLHLYPDFKGRTLHHTFFFAYTLYDRYIACHHTFLAKKWGGMCFINHRIQAIV